MSRIVIENAHSAPLPDWAVDRPAGAYFGYFEDGPRQHVFLATRESIRVASGYCGWDWTVEVPVDWPRMNREAGYSFDTVTGEVLTATHRSHPHMRKREMIPHEDPAARWFDACMAGAYHRFKLSLKAD